MFYNKKPKGLNGALQDLGIQFEGREHSGTQKRPLVQINPNLKIKTSFHSVVAILPQVWMTPGTQLSWP